MNNKIVDDDFWSNIFIVTCQGFSASAWFATSLNNHESIMCAHNVTPITNFILSKNFDKSTHRKMSTIIHRHYRPNTEFAVSHLFKLMKTIQASEFYGNIHAFQLSNLKNAIIPEEVPILNLIRNPISTINSYYHELIKPASETLIPEPEQIYQKEIIIQFLDLFQKEYDYLNIAKEHNDEIDKYSNHEIYSFLKALSIIERIGEDYNSFPLIERVITVPMEKLTSDKEYFKEILSILVRDKIELQTKEFEEYLNKVISSEPSNKHSAGASRTPVDIFNGWQNWQRIAFCKTLRKANLNLIYQNAEYNLDFVD